MTDFIDRDEVDRAISGIVSAAQRMYAVNGVGSNIEKTKNQEAMFVLGISPSSINSLTELCVDLYVNHEGEHAQKIAALSLIRDVFEGHVLTKNIPSVIKNKNKEVRGGVIVERSTYKSQGLLDYTKVLFERYATCITPSSALEKVLHKKSSPQL